MTHLEDGMLVAIRDGALVDGDAIGHLRACVTCQESLEAVRARAEAIAEVLASLDAPIETDRGRAAVRARLDARREADRRPKSHLRAHLGRAAAVLLLAAGAAYALPESPLRAWLGAGEERVVGGTVTAVQAPAAQQEEPGAGGVEVPLPTGRIRIVLTDARPGSEIEVRWTDGASAAISAGPGTSFSIGEGRAEAQLEDGPVRLEIPRYAAVFSVEVDGLTYLRRNGGGLEVLVPPVERSEDAIRFTVTER